MSETPRTDEVMIMDCASESESYLNMRNHARQLERELAAAQARIAELEQLNRMVSYTADAHSKDADKWSMQVAVMRSERDEARREAEAQRKRADDAFENWGKVSDDLAFIKFADKDEILELKREAEALRADAENLATMLRRGTWLARKQVGDTGIKVWAGQARDLLTLMGRAGNVLRGDAAIDAARSKP